jgi:hypothetical protein
MSVPMLDSAFAPSDEQLRCLYDGGARVYGGYLGGLRVYQDGFATWAANNFEAFRCAHAAGFSLVGYFVGDQRLNGDPFGYDRGLQRGQAALAAARAAGVPMVIALDVEDRAVGQDVDDYCRGFADGVRPSAYATALYGNPPTLVYGPYFDATIAAEYPATPPVNPAVGPRHAWQYQGGHDECGLNVDRGVADEWFLTNTAGDAPMTPQERDELRRVVARIGYLFRRFNEPGVQEQQFQDQQGPADLDLFLAAIVDTPGSDTPGIHDTLAAIAALPGELGALDSRVTAVEQRPGGGVTAHHHNFGLSATGSTSDPI